VSELSRCFEGWRAYGVVGLDEGVVNSDDLDIVVLDPGALSAHRWLSEALNEGYSRVAEDNATNAAETVDTDLLRTSVAVDSW